MQYNYLVIEGNIGAGKTSLVTRMAFDLNAKPILESFTENPFLLKFYKDPEQYSLSLELSFLVERYQQLQDELNKRDFISDNIIADYYFSKSLIFARITLTEDEFILYRKLYQIIHQQLPVPDLYVYLHQPVERLIDNIRKRGRDYEKLISADYLFKLQRGYMEYFENQNNLKILVIDAGKIDYINNSEDFIKIRNCILNGKFSKGINRIIL